MTELHTTLRQQILSIRANADRLIGYDLQESFTQDQTNEIKEALVSLQRSLGTAFPALKAVRKEVFALSGSSTDASIT